MVLPACHRVLYSRIAELRITSCLDLLTVEILLRSALFVSLRSGVRTPTPSGSGQPQFRSQMDSLWRGLFSNAIIAITTQIRLPSLAPHKSNAPHKSVTRRTDRLTILLGEQDPEYVCVYLEFGAQGLWLFFSLRTYRVPSSCHKKRTKYEAEIFCAILLYPLGCPDWQGSWNVLLAHLELHLSNELVSQVLRSSRLAKL
jgi:hypothetical protein